MSIFGIIGFTFCISLIVSMVFCLVAIIRCKASKRFWIIAIITSIAVWVSLIFVGIGLATESEQIYVAQYETQKLTIEQSLKSDMLTGLERVELVNKAIELNGELAKRKVSFNLWHTVYYDNSIYDNVDFIVFE